MSKSSVNCVFLFVILMSVFQNGLSTRCFVCNSQVQATCKDPFSNQGLEMEECTYNSIERFNKQEMSKYVKIVLPSSHGPDAEMVCQKIIFESGDVTRSCQVDSDGLTNTMCRMFKGDGIRTKYCDICFVDGCNGSSRINIPAAIGLLSIVSLVIFSRL